VDRVEEVEEGVNMVVVDGCHGVVRLTKPEQDDARGGEGGWGGGGIMEAAVGGKLEYIYRNIYKGKIYIFKKREAVA
jgi:hypothetical protein